MQQKAHGQLKWQVFLADWNPAIQSSACDLGNNFHFPLFITFHFYLFFRAKTQDYMRANLQQARDHFLVIDLRFYPRGHLHGFALLPIILVGWIACHAVHFLLLPVENAASSAPFMASRIDNDHGVVSIISRFDCFPIRARSERRSEVTMVEIVGPSIMACTP